MDEGEPSSLEVTRDLGDSLPIKWYQGASVSAWVFITLFGGFVVAFSTFLLGSLAQDGDLNPSGILVLAVFLTVGVLLFLVGINQLRSGTFIWIDASSVRFKRTALIWGAVDWTEPLSAFRGVLPAQRRSHSRERGFYTTYEIHLKHARDPGRDIMLYRARSQGTSEEETDHRDRAEGFARLLGVPVLAEREGGGFEAREPGDLDKSLRQRAREGSLDAPDFDPRVIPSNSGLEVRRTPAGYVFEARLTRLLWIALFVGAPGAGCLYWYFGPGLGVSSGYGWLVPYMGAGMVLASLVVAHTALYRVERLEVSRDGVRFACVKPGTELEDSGASFLTSEEIEEVGIRKNDWGRFRVTLSGDQQTAQWGTSLSRSERKLVRDAIVETLTG